MVAQLGIHDNSHALHIQLPAEETGYSGKILNIGPAVPSSPGLTTETMHIVTMETEELPAKHEHEAAELIEVHTIELNPASIRGLFDHANASGSLIDAKLYSWLSGWLATGAQ